MSSQKRLLVAACAAIVVVLVSALTTAQIGERHRVIFVSDRDGNMEIYSMWDNGDSQTNLTVNEADDVFPAVSPDGTKIAFTTERDGDTEIHVMDLNGDDQTNLTFTEGVSEGPPSGLQMGARSSTRATMETSTSTS